MKLLVNESPLLVLPTLAAKLGLEEAIILQQLHFRLQHQGVEKNGARWYCQTYARWAEQLPFWHKQKVKRLFLRLEKCGLVKSTDKFNRFYVDRTKWYAIDYEAFEAFCAEADQLALVSVVTQDTPTVHPETLPQFTGELPEGAEGEPSNLKDLKDVNKDIKDSEVPRQIDAVMAYLNLKTEKQYNPQTKAHRRLLTTLLKAGYHLQDFMDVIDHQVRCWQQDDKMRKYLRPMTLFRAANFDAYLNEARVKAPAECRPQSVELDYDAGEDW